MATGTGTAVGGQVLTCFRESDEEGVLKSGFFGEDPAVKPTVVGSRSDGTALASLLSGLASMGLLIDETVP